MKAPKKRLHEESGIGLLELAIIIPVLCLILAGLVDYGQLIREMNTLSLVARDAARTAASHARSARISNQGEARVACSNIVDPDTIPCGGTAAQLRIREYDVADATRTPDSILVAAKKAACMGLQSAQLDAGSFTVTPRIVRENEVPGDSSTYLTEMIQVHIQRDDRNCLLCWGNILAGTSLHGDSFFVLEDKCG